MNTRVPAELRIKVKATARRKGLTVDEYVTRTLSAAVESEEQSEPGFLEAWEKFLSQHRKNA